MNRQKYASFVGICIVFVHLFLTFYLWVVFRTRFPTTIIAEIATPLTAAFFLGVVKWVIDTQGKITSNDTVGFTYVVITAAVIFSLLGGLVALPLMYTSGSISTDQLNSWYLYLDTSIGGAFGLIFSDMFGTKNAPAVVVAPAPPHGQAQE